MTEVLKELEKSDSESEHGSHSEDSDNLVDIHSHEGGGDPERSKRLVKQKDIER